MNIQPIATLPFKEGDVLEGDDGRRYRVSESYTNFIVVYADGSDYEKVISRPSFDDFKKVSP